MVTLAENLEILSIDKGTIVLTLINTLILFLVLRHFLFGRVNKMLEDRQSEVANTYQKADESMENAKRLEANYGELISNAKEESAEIVKNATKRAQLRSDEIISNAKRDANGIMLKANDDIEREKKRARNQIKEEISDIALLMAEKVVEKEISAEDNKRLIDEFIENVGEL